MGGTPDLLNMLVCRWIHNLRLFVCLFVFEGFHFGGMSSFEGWSGGVCLLYHPFLLSRSLFVLPGHSGVSCSAPPHSHTVMFDLTVTQEQRSQWQWTETTEVINQNGSSIFKLLSQPFCLSDKKLLTYHVTLICRNFWVLLLVTSGTHSGNDTCIHHFPGCGR